MILRTKTSASCRILNPHPNSQHHSCEVTPSSLPGAPLSRAWYFPGMRTLPHVYTEWSVSQPGMRRLFAPAFPCTWTRGIESQSLSDIFSPGLPPANLSPSPLSSPMHSFIHLVNNHTLSWAQNFMRCCCLQGPLGVSLDILSINLLQSLIALNSQRSVSYTFACLPALPDGGIRWGQNLYLWINVNFIQFHFLSSFTNRMGRCDEKMNFDVVLIKRDEELCFSTSGQRLVAQGTILQASRHPLGKSHTGHGKCFSCHHLIVAYSLIWILVYFSVLNQEFYKFCFHKMRQAPGGHTCKQCPIQPICGMLSGGPMTHGRLLQCQVLASVCVLPEGDHI